jgi:hypothetical protein
MCIFRLVLPSLALLLASCSSGEAPADLGELELVIASDATPIVRQLSESERRLVWTWVLRDDGAWREGEHYFVHKGPVFVRSKTWELFIVDGTAVICGHNFCRERPASVDTLVDLFAGQD